MSIEHDAFLEIFDVTHPCGWPHANGSGWFWRSPNDSPTVWMHGIWHLPRSKTFASRTLLGSCLLSFPLGCAQTVPAHRQSMEGCKRISERNGQNQRKMIKSARSAILVAKFSPAHFYSQYGPTTSAATVMGHMAFISCMAYVDPVISRSVVPGSTEAMTGEDVCTLCNSTMSSTIRSIKDLVLPPHSTTTKKR